MGTHRTDAAWAAFVCDCWLCRVCLWLLAVPGLSVTAGCAGLGKSGRFPFRGWDRIMELPRWRRGVGARGGGERLIDWFFVKLYFSTVKIIISARADSHICRCYNTTNNQDIHSEILCQTDIDKYSISNNNNNNTYKTRQQRQRKWKREQWKATGGKKANSLGHLQRGHGKGRDRIKLKKATIITITTKRKRILN